MSGGHWSPEQDLAALLDAMSEELLAAPDREVRAALREAGEDPDEAARFMRRLLADADTRAVVPPAADLAARARRVMVARMQ